MVAQSCDLAAEVADLLPALAGRVSAVSRVIYHLSSWNTAPSRIEVAGRTVRLDGYRYQPINTVYIVGTDRDRIALLVIPPATDPADARAMLSAAATADNASTVDELLRAGVATAQTKSGETGRHAWESEGGAIDGPPVESSQSVAGRTSTL